MVFTEMSCLICVILSNTRYILNSSQEGCTKTKVINKPSLFVTTKRFSPPMADVGINEIPKPDGIYYGIRVRQHRHRELPSDIGAVFVRVFCPLFPFDSLLPYHWVALSDSFLLCRLYTSLNSSRETGRVEFSNVWGEIHLKSFDKLKYRWIFGKYVNSWTRF